MGLSGYDSMVIIDMFQSIVGIQCMKQHYGINMPQADFNPPGEKWQRCLNIVIALPPKPPRLDSIAAFQS